MGSYGIGGRSCGECSFAEYRLDRFTRQVDARAVAEELIMCIGSRLVRLWRVLVKHGQRFNHTKPLTVGDLVVGEMVSRFASVVNVRLRPSHG